MREREQFFKRQQKRLPRLEGASVASEGGTTGEAARAVDVSTAGRPPRSNVRAIDGKPFYENDQVLMIAGGDNDAPTILGKSPYIF